MGSVDERQAAPWLPSAAGWRGGGGETPAGPEIGSVCTSRICDDQAGTFAISYPGACLLPFWVPGPSSPLSACGLCRLVSAPPGPGWHAEAGGGGAARLAQAEGQGLPSGVQAVGGGSLISPEWSVAAAETQGESPMPFPGRTGRQQHLLKLWSLAPATPGAIWKALLRKPGSPMSSELREAGMGGPRGFLPGQSLGSRAPGQARPGRSSPVGMWLPHCQASPAGPEPDLVLGRSTPTSWAVSFRVYCAWHVAHRCHPRPGVWWARRCGPSQGRGG